MEIPLLVGRTTVGSGVMTRITGRYKQYMAYLVGAAADEQTVIEICACPNTDEASAVVVATFILTGTEKSDISTMVEMLTENHFARVVSIEGGEAWAYGVN